MFFHESDETQRSRISHLDSVFLQLRFQYPIVSRAIETLRAIPGCVLESTNVENTDFSCGKTHRLPYTPFLRVEHCRGGA